MSYTKSSQRPIEVIGGNTDFYTIYTLVDTTDSGVYNPKSNPIGFKQAQNLNTMMQLISLRTQPLLSSVSEIKNADVSEFNFGNDFTGLHSVWIIKFASSTEKAWFKDDDYTHWLRHDFNKTPVYGNLNNTAILNIEIIETTNPDSLNTYFHFSENI